MKIRKTPLVLLMGIILVCLALTGCPEDAALLGLHAELTEQEMRQPEAKYYNPAFSPLSPDVQAAISGGPADCNRALKFENINDLLKPGYLDIENGYCLNPDDGTGFVAVKTDFPGATADMIHWWFWWHAYPDIRYKIWCPGDHYAIGIKNKQQAGNPALTYEQRYVNNTQFPYEDTGNGIFKLSIHFVPPEAFGFNTGKFEEAGIAAMVCARVGYMVGDLNIEHTYMCHEFRKTHNGLELRSRFWPGKALPGVALRKLAITEDVVKGLASHNAHEYSHLAEFLPEIYGEFK
ncbi:MAG: hydrolase [Deltaproteobacteria bacterium HGW-Deltaproteobacteria-13]|nr:MAG: hydrolase [Deltaproteobacteria bacterium HGW-Deltaproteobacteria-13]